MTFVECYSAFSSFASACRTWDGVRVDPAGNLTMGTIQGSKRGRKKNKLNGGLEVSNAGEIMDTWGIFQLATMTYHNWIVFFDADTWKKTAPMIREDGPRYFRAWVKLVP
jgi:hypothetical protein